MHRTLLALFICLAAPAMAAPAHYTLEPAKSTVGFQTDFGPDHINGHMPITRAELTLDFQNVANSKVAVTLNSAGADAGFPFATQAMKGPKVLDTGSHPEITFASTSVTPEGDGARVQGNVTIRGVTRPMTLTASIYRQQGTEQGDLSHLTVRLTGAVERSDFGATGWSDMVSNTVRLDILARLSRVD